MPAKGEARGTDSGSGAPSPDESDGEYVRRAYERAIDWYKVAETKAQMLLTANGILVITLRSVGWKA
jgi:hypothetical protein